MTMWFAFTLNGGPGSAVDAPGGYVREVEVIHDESPDGTKIVRYVESGRVSSIGGPFCSGRLFSTEAEGWAYCSRRLREQAARFDAAASACAAKAAIEVAA
jgi:hypothetical protein